MWFRGWTLLLTILVIGLADRPSANAQPHETNFLFYRKDLSRWPLTDSLVRDTVFQFFGYVQLRGSTAHFEYFDDEYTPEPWKPGAQRWPGPRIQNLFYKLEGNVIELKAALSITGYIANGDSINWPQLMKSGAKFLLVPCEMPGKFKPLVGPWSLVTKSLRTQKEFLQIIDFESKVKDLFKQPYGYMQGGNVEWPEDRQSLPAGSTTYKLENGSKILVSMDVLSLNWDEKKGHYRVEGFNNPISSRFTHHRYSGTLEKLKLPSKQMRNDLQEKLLGDWVSIGVWGIKHPTGDTVQLTDACSIHIDKDLIRVTRHDKKAMTLDRPWQISSSGRLLKMETGNSFNAHEDWPFWFVGDTLFIRLTMYMSEAPYYLKELRLKKK